MFKFVSIGLLWYLFYIVNVRIVIKMKNIVINNISVWWCICLLCLFNIWLNKNNIDIGSNIILFIFIKLF